MNIGVFISKAEGKKIVKGILSQNTNAMAMTKKKTEQDEAPMSVEQDAAPMPVAKPVLPANSGKRTSTHKLMKKYEGLDKYTLQYNPVLKKYYLSLCNGWIVHS